MSLSFTIAGGSLDLALAVAFQNQPHGALAYSIEPGSPRTLLLHWTKRDPRAGTPRELNELLCPHDVTMAVQLVRKWLDTEQYPDEPQHDGDNSKSFIVSTGPWGHVGNDWTAFVAIRPDWQIWSK